VKKKKKRRRAADATPETDTATMCGRRASVAAVMDAHPAAPQAGHSTAGWRQSRCRRRPKHTAFLKRRTIALRARALHGSAGSPMLHRCRMSKPSAARPRWPINLRPTTHRMDRKREPAARSEGGLARGRALCKRLSPGRREGLLSGGWTVREDRGAGVGQIDRMVADATEV